MLRMRSLGRSHRVFVDTSDCACRIHLFAIALGCAVFVTSLPRAGFALDGVSDDGSGIFAYRDSPQYCGIAAALACLRALGEQAPADLDSLRFVSLVSGSTLADLKHLVDRHGAPSIAAQGLQVDDLHFLANPAILHVRPDIADKHFNHWVAYLGADTDGRFVIYDVNRGYTRMSSGELAASWDGTVLIVGASEWVGRGLYPRTSHILLTLMLLAFVALRGFGPHYPRLIRAGGGVSSLVQFALIVAAMAALYHTVASVGVLRNARLATRIAARDRVESGRVVDLEELRRLNAAGGVVLVDARPRSDYDAGTILGAVSLPADSTLADAATLLKRIPKESRLVVFCANASCPYAEQVSRFLAINGYLDASVYSGGYQEWVAADR